MRAPHSRTTHRYTTSSAYEQTLDIYSPVDPPSDKDLPLVVLVVGSAWLGHRFFIYRFCSWWNSSGPASIARLGCVCVCVRHRGSFPRLQPPFWLVAILAAVYLYSWSTAVAVALGGCIALYPLAYGAADHEQMLEDVSNALVWVREHRTDKLLIAPGATAAAGRLVFGGYSSGAHVAASLLARPDLLSKANLKIDGVLHLSGVLGVRETSVVETWARHIPTQIVKMVFGSEGAAALPSPVDDTNKLPLLPHLLIHCKHEVFNLQPIERGMGVMFCSEVYEQRLAARGIEVLRLPVDSDHWNILDSSNFAAALETAFIEQKWPPSHFSDGWKHVRQLTGWKQLEEWVAAEHPWGK